MAERTRRGKVIHSWDEVPRFRSEAEESDWWSTHSLGDELLDQMKPMPLSAGEKAYRRSRTRPIGVRFDESTLNRLKTLAARRHKGYQSLLKEFIVERLYEEEKREGLVGVHKEASRDATASQTVMRPGSDSELTATSMYNRERRRTTANRRLPARIRGERQRTSATVRGRKDRGL